MVRREAEICWSYLTMVNDIMMFHVHNMLQPAVTGSQNLGIAPLSANVYESDRNFAILH